MGITEKLWTKLAEEWRLIRRIPCACAVVWSIGLVLIGAGWYSVFKLDLALKSETIKAYQDRFGDLRNGPPTQATNASLVHEQQLVLKHDSISFALVLERMASVAETNNGQPSVLDDQMIARFAKLDEQLENARLDVSKIRALYPVYMNGWTPKLYRQMAEAITNLANQLPNE